MSDQGAATDEHDYLLKYGHPKKGQEVPVFLPTDTAPGSAEKVRILTERAESGLPLWHPEDRINYSGLTGCVLPVPEPPQTPTD